MSKENKRDGLTVMQKTILALEARNAVMDGKLFTVFGRGKNKALIFPTPLIVRENGEPIADELLLVTNDDVLAIHFDRRKTGIGVESVSTIVEENLGKRYGLLSASAGYTDKQLRLVGSLLISREGTLDCRGIDPCFDSGKTYANCRLVKVDTARVEEILTANIKRVEDEWATSQKVNKVLDKTI